MASAVSDEMTDQRRALLTEREREILTGDADVTDNYRYSVESRVRKRIRDRLADDVDLIRERYPEMFDELIYPVVCQPGGEAVDAVEVPEGADETEDIADNGLSDVETPEPADAPPAPETAADVEGEGIRDEVTEAVEDVAGSWEDSDERLSTRKGAAAIVLQHALDTETAVGKSSDVVAGVRKTHPVSGQNEETYWRKNIRPVLKAYGEYNQGKHGYTVDKLDE